MEAEHSMETRSITGTAETERRNLARRRDDAKRAGEPATMAPLSALSFREAKARAIAGFETAYLRELLEIAQGNVSLAARLAGKERSRFNRLVRKHRLEAKAFRPPMSGHSSGA
jgi:DNA-binding NtrC family response regulator